ncbi:MAG: hypothetical protein QOJ02_171 [Acidobacteriota bacterium]|jgi:hypothetical protein|nr:hypothetical protein [Acidobacteriota bacterium]
MSRIPKAYFAVILLLAVQLSGRAQNDTRPFNPLAESVESAIKEQFPSWKRTSIPPAQPNRSDTFTEDVIIDQWRSDEAIVKVSILIHPSKEEAKKSFKEFLAGVKVNGYLQDVSNESYEWGIQKSVAFRKGRYTVYVSAAPIYEEDELMDTTALPKENKYSKTFAQIVAKALKDLD